MATNPMDLKRSVQEEKSRVYRELRDGADGLRNAIAARDQLQTWDPSTRAGALRSLEKKTNLGRDVGALLAYFDNLHSPALDLIAKDKFELMYQIYGDIDRKAVMGANTMSVRVPIKWDKLDVKVQLYAGDLDRLMSQPKLAGFGRNGIPNRDDVAKNTGWNRDRVRNFPDNRMYLLQALLEQMNTGQSKLTRLVKGYMLLLEVTERQSVDFVIGDYTHVQYAPDDVINSFEMGNRAYVFNSKPASEAHTTFLLRMCEEYPPAAFGSHVRIPRDAETICVVSQGGRLNPIKAVTLTPGLVYSSLLTYAMDTSCTGLLQQAQIIACSLHQNRYFSTVELPQVVSLYDLMIPAFVADSSAVHHSVLSRDLGKAVGRVHQMLGFVVAKDMIGASNLQAKRGYNPASTIRSFLNSNAALVHKMAANLSGIGILDVTPKMRLFQRMEEADYADLLNVSIFEGLWLVRDATSSVNNGPVSFLKAGDKVRTGDVSPYDELKEELQLAGVLVEDKKLPDGAFTTVWVGIRSLAERPIRRVEKTTREVDLVKECEYRPGEDLKSKGKRVRRNIVYGTREAPTKLAITNVLRTPEKPKERSTTTTPERVSEPPPYESERSSSPVTDDTNDTYQRLAEEAMHKTQVAYEARRRINKSSLDMLKEEVEGVEVDKVEATRTKNERVLSILSATDVQLAPEERIKALLRRGGLGGEEREQWFRLILRHLDISEANRCGDMAELVNKLVQSGLKSESTLLRGNSKYTKVINVQIEAANPASFDTVVSDMRRSGSKWSGAIDDAARPGLRYVIKSAAFEEWLLDMGVDLDAKVSGRPMAHVLVDKLVNSPHFSLRKTEVLAEWLNGVSIDILPTTITDADIPGSVPAVLDWYKASTSLGVRKFSQDDSRWLELAGAGPAGWLPSDKLRELCAEFRVPTELRQQLREKYGLFKGKAQ